MKRFAFIVHLRTIEDIFIACPFLPKFLFPILEKPLLFLFSRLTGRLGFSVRSKFKIGKDIEGYIILIWLTGEQMMSYVSVEESKKARSRVLAAVLYAQNKLKCNIVGLGALTASRTAGGEWLAERPEVKLTITHGDSYSVGVAIEGIQKAIKMMGLKPSKTTVAIVGATGIIGAGLVRQLAPIIENELILIGRNSKKLEEIKAKVHNFVGEITISLDVEDVKRADIIITATSWNKAIIGPDLLKRGAIIYEVSQPRNASPSILKERPDVVVIDGAYTAVPENIDFWWMGRPHHVTFACMAETIMQTMEGDFQNHIGEINPQYVEIVRQRARKYGFGHAPFTSFNNPIEITTEKRIIVSKEIPKSVKEPAG